LLVFTALLNCASKSSRVRYGLDGPTGRLGNAVFICKWLDICVHKGEQGPLSAGASIHVTGRAKLCATSRMYASPRAPSVPYVSKATGTSTPAGMTARLLYHASLTSSAALAAAPRAAPQGPQVCLSWGAWSLS